MIKILFSGNKHTFRHQCKTCGCDFTYHLCDLTDNGDRHFIWIRCPECGEKEIADTNK